ncbi:hypothetical protein LA080_008967 [Diaporthe eres]|nr:hypothetical protein LA080_008967 [Diaporthe eres]
MMTPDDDDDVVCWWWCRDMFRPVAVSHSFHSADIDIKSHAAVTGSSDPSDSLGIGLRRRHHLARRKIEVYFDEEISTVVNSAVAKGNILLVLPTADPDLDTEIEALEMTMPFSREQKEPVSFGREMIVCFMRDECADSVGFLQQVSCPVGTEKIRPAFDYMTAASDQEPGEEDMQQRDPPCRAIAQVQTCSVGQLNIFPEKPLVQGAHERINSDLGAGKKPKAYELLGADENPKASENPKADSVKASCQEVIHTAAFDEEAASPRNEQR